MKLNSCISCILIGILASSPVWAESPAETAPDGIGLLQLRLLDSDGPRALVNSRTRKGFSVQVTDGNGRPVGDAAVAFRFPDSGATAAFADGSHSAVAYTDNTGRAHVGDFQWTGQAGRVPLRVTATKADSHAGLLLEQTLAESAEVSRPVSTGVDAPAQPVAIPESEEPATHPEEMVLGSSSTIRAAPMPGVLASSAVNPYRILHTGVAPAISISSTEHDTGYHASFNKKKWIIMGIVAGVGAAAAAALMSGKSSASTASPAASGVSVGTPTISIGHP